MAGVRSAFVYRHARNISQLGDDVRCLVAHEQFDSTPIIVRAMLESLFKLIAATKVGEAAVGIVLSEINEEVSQIQKWIKIVDGDCAQLTNNVVQLSSFAEGLRKENNVESKKDWNVFECAKAAKLDAIYRQFYFLFSKHTHATSSGIIAQESDVVRKLVFEAVVFVVLCTVGHIVQVIRTENPQQYVDEAAKLGQVAINLIQSD